MGTRTDYEKQVTDFLDRFQLRFGATFAGWACPRLCDGGEKSEGGHALEHMHGPRWLIGIARAQTNASIQPPALAFDFWSSYTDSHEKHRGRAYLGFFRLNNGGKRPTPYSVLASISGDIHCPDSFADFCAEYGYDEDSRKA